MKRAITFARTVVSEPSIGYDLLRIYLGIALVVRGALFVSDPSRVMVFLEPAETWFMPALTAHYVGMAHLGGGVLLMLGLATRIAALVQLPALLGAVFSVHFREGLLASGQSLELAGLVLVMLVVFTVFGAGPVSLDQVVFARRRAPGDDVISGMHRPTRAH
jgi:putative oxidoreductase